ncbi:MAG: inositol monophosphatase family protein, partial [Isosphaeraceae bacterium]
MMAHELEVAEEAARAGGVVAARFFRAGATVFTKESAPGKASSYNLVSEADLEAERAIVAVIRKAFPDHAVLGEELHGGDSAS